MIYRSGENEQVDILKTKFGLQGRVYLVGDVIQSLESHKKMFPNSSATNILEAEEEYLAYLAEQRERQLVLSQEESENELQ